MEATVQAPQSRNLQELQSFLGLLNYYGKFIPNLATLVQSAQQPPAAHPTPMNAYKHFRKPICTGALSSSQAPAHYDPSLPITLAGDALVYGIDAVISHTPSDGNEHPIAFASHTLSSSELQSHPD